MHVMHYIERFDFGLGGVVQCVNQSVAALVKRGIEVTLVTGYNRDLPPAWLASGAVEWPRVHVLDRPAGRYGWLSRRQLDALDRWSADCDVVHLHGPWDLGANRWARRLRRRGKPYLVSTHGMLDDWSLRQKPWRKRFMLALSVGRYLRQAATIHCTAAEEARQVVKNVPGLRTTLCIPYILDWGDEESMPDAEVAYAAFPQLRRDAFKILFLSRVHYKKGIDILLEALAASRFAGGQVQAIIAGPGEPAYVARLQARAARLRIDGNLLWLGMVRDPVKTALFRAADVFVLPTHQENFGIVLVEAMIAGLPVITTRGVDIWQELKEGGAEIVDLDSSAFSAALIGFYRDPQERKRRGTVGAAFVRQWLDVDRVMDQQIRMYRLACGENV